MKLKIFKDLFICMVQDVRELYERKLERTNNLYLELSSVLLQIETREKELAARERLLLDRGHRDTAKKMSAAARCVSATATAADRSSMFLSSSPESPVHAVGAAAARPVVRTNPMFEHYQGEAGGPGPALDTVAWRNQENSYREEHQYHPTPEKLKQVQSDCKHFMMI